MSILRREKEGRKTRPRKLLCPKAGTATSSPMKKAASPKFECSVWLICLVDHNTCYNYSAIQGVHKAGVAASGTQTATHHIWSLLVVHCRNL
jgi:hypothetical protein